MRNIGAEVRAKRKMYGISAEGLAEVLELSARSIYDFEHGRLSTKGRAYLAIKGWHDSK